MDTNRLAMIKEMLEANPNDPFLKYAAALEFRKNNDLDKAIHTMEEIIREHADYLPTYYQLGKMYEEKGMMHIAIKHYKAGRIVATQQNERKILGELNEALMLLDAEEDI
jgi:tetratricopeptide (TPR) repeat protein